MVEGVDLTIDGPTQLDVDHGIRNRGENVSRADHLGTAELDDAVAVADRFRLVEDLHSFAKANENRLYKLLKACMDTQVDLKGLVKSTVRYDFFNE